MGFQTAGLKVPWIYIRSKVAERWGVPPWVVDESPIGELETTLTLMQIEGECQPRP